MEDIPTMPQLQLLKLPADQEGDDMRIVQEIGTNYLRFGTMLLNDEQGSLVKSFQHQFQRDCSSINWNILQKWVSGVGRKPTNWKTLVTVLKEAQLEELARKIENCLANHNEINESANLGIPHSTTGNTIPHSLSIKSWVIIFLVGVVAILVALLVTK